MTETAEFDDFVRARSTHLLRLAYLLTRDHGNAEDLLQTALARSWSAWRRIDGDPEPYVRRVLVNTYTSWRGRRWHGERPSSALPEVPQPDAHAAIDARDEVHRALTRLPRQQRAVLVLRYFEDMSEAQISEALGISSGTVKSYAARGLAALRTDPSLEPAASDVPAGLERLAAVHERIRHNRRRKVGAAVTAALVALALLLGYVLSPLAHRRSLPPVAPMVGDYVDGYRIVDRIEGGTSERPWTLGWAPTVAGTAMILVCYLRGPAGPDDAARLQVMLNVDVLGSVPCGHEPRLGPPMPTGVPAGRMMAITITVSPRTQVDGDVFVLIGDPVPFNDPHH